MMSVTIWMLILDFFERVKCANLSLKPSKCKIGYDTVDFLDHTLKEDAQFSVAFFHCRFFRESQRSLHMHMVCLSLNISRTYRDSKQQYKPIVWLVVP